MTSLSEEDHSLEQPLRPSSSSRIGTAWDRRRRRLLKNKEAEAVEHDDAAAASTTSAAASRRGRRRNKATGAEEVDPYESDPGESYRDHCVRIRGVSNKSCLAMPKFLRNNRVVADQETVLTAPPSPMTSEMGDLFGQVPASLPPTLARVRYSLRSSITDGSEKQPSGPSIMERRELRPNGIHLNVSHWSDEGGRPYMEDRYVG